MVATNTKNKTQRERLTIRILDSSIKAKQVKLVGEGGVQLVSVDEAIKVAEDANLDLVVVNEGETPVCKVMNYGKYLYEQQKKMKQASKSKSELKEIKFGPNIADHDLEVKAKNASRLLSEGDKVKVTITYKGRMMRYIDGGIGKLNELNNLIEQNHRVDKAPAIDGNRVYMVISPSK